MLGQLFARLTEKMVWFLVVPSSVLIFALACLTFSYSHVVRNAKDVSFELWGSKLVANKCDDISNQQQLAIQSAINQLEVTLKTFPKLEKNVPVKHFHDTPHLVASIPRMPENQSNVIAGLSEIITNLKSQNEKISEQRKNLKELKYELSQTKK